MSSTTTEKHLSYDPKKNEPGLLAKLYIYAVLTSAIPVNLKNAVTKAFRGKDGLHPYSTAVSTATFGYLLGAFTPQQARWGLGFAPSLDAYKAWAEEEAKVPLRLTKIAAGEDGVESRILWIGEEPWGKPGKKVMLFSHGGGFALPLIKGHVRQLEWMRKSVAEKGVDLSMAAVEYSLAPDAKYPTPYIQAAMALRHLLDQGISPSDIIIGGDSAGGNITLGLLSHILHPHPSLPAIKLSTPLAGTILISPWVSFAHNKPSFRTNESKDFLCAATLTAWASLEVSGTSFENDVASGQYLGEAQAAPESYWEGLPTVTKTMGLTRGEKEVFHDDVAEFAEKMKRVKGLEVHTVAAKEEIHDGCLMVFMQSPEAPKEVPETERTVEEWIAKAML